MVSHLLTTLLIAQQQPAPPVVPDAPWYTAWYAVLGIVVLVILLSASFGTWMAPMVRMQDASWKFTVIALVILSAAALMWLRWPPKLGIDLNGGTILSYELDKEDRKAALDSGADPEDLTKRLIAAISKRVDPAGVKQVTIRSIGGDAIEVTVPEVDPTEIGMLKKVLQTTGHLEFRILGDPRADQGDIERARRSDWKVEDPSVDARRDSGDQKTKYLIELASEMEEARRTAKPGEKQAPAPTIVLLAGRPGAEWVDVPEKDAAAVQADKNLVTRTLDGKTQKLVILGEVIARWVQIGKDDKGRLRIPPESAVSRPSRKGDGFDVLVMIDSQNVEGKYLKSATAGVGDGPERSVDFVFNPDGARLFGELTGANIPKGNLIRRLGIILDDELLSAPNLNSRISERGQITGDFSKAEVDWLVGVLDAGSLPAKLNPVPISEIQTNATLGAETIRQGEKAIIISMIIVPVGMILYYRFAGLVAGLAVLLNLFLVVAVMVGVQAAFTLAGLAGLALSVGMSVDANILVFERMREELERGATLRMAIRNGFSRAGRTIFDSNATTVISAVALYIVGTEQLKGFAVTLILGLAMNLFTAIFCSRLVFDMVERNRWLTTLRMTSAFGKTNINFVGAIRYCLAGSFLVIAIGMAAIYLRWGDFLDIDFRGGTKVQIVFKEPQQQDKVEARLKAYSETATDSARLDAVSATGVGEGHTNFNIETVNSDRKAVLAALKQVFGDELKTNRMRFSPDQIQAIAAPKAEAGGSGAAPSDTKATGSASGTQGESQKEEKAPEKPAPGKPDTEDGAQLSPAASRTVLASLDPRLLFLAQVNGKEGGGADSAQVAQPSVPPAITPVVQSTGAVGTQPVVAATDAGQKFEITADATPNPFAGGTSVPLDFDDKIKQDVLSELVRQAGRAAGFVQAGASTEPDAAKASDAREAPASINFRFRVSHPSISGESQVAQNRWLLEVTLNHEETVKLLAELQKLLADEPVFPMATNVGGQVAGNMQLTAFAAIFISFSAMVIYLWIRFQHARYGMAAVLALMHNVVVMVGILALSEYFKMIPYLEGFKLNLVILAGLLTLIGYSINDTIVVFDRIRELRGKRPFVTRDIVNEAINSTLSRTLLTSTLTLAVLGVLFFVGGPGVHGFSFTLLIGILVGTYSSVYIAAPVLLWMEERAASRSQTARESQRKATSTAG